MDVMMLLLCVVEFSFLTEGNGFFPPSVCLCNILPGSWTRDGSLSTHYLVRTFSCILCISDLEF